MNSREDTLIKALEDAAFVIHSIGLHTEYGHGPDFSACDMSICVKNIRILEDIDSGNACPDADCVLAPGHKGRHRTSAEAWQR